VQRDASRPGGGTLPLLEIEGPVCALDPAAVGADALAAALRSAEPPVIARVSQGMVLLDPRTIFDAELDEVAIAARDALGD
jgi:L-seryl-tRNA(Ser) seleniumtransferase